MTDQRLQDLLHERVSDLTTTDLAGPAWTAGRAVRRRRRGCAAGGVAAALVLAAVVVPTVVGRPDGGGPPVADRSTVPGETYAGYAVTHGPTPAQEAGLAVTPSRLPSRLDVRDRATSLVGGTPARVAVGNVGDDGTLREVRLLDDDGWTVVDTARLVPVDGLAPLVNDMLSPDGRWVLFPQPDAVDLYDVLDRTWTTVPVEGTFLPRTAQWVSAETFSVDLNGSAGSSVRLVPVPGSRSSRTGTVLVDLTSPDGATPYGPVVANGEVAFPPSVSRGDARAQAVSGLEAGIAPEGVATASKILVQRDGGDSQWLVVGGERRPMPCPVVGWLDADTVVYLSRGPVPRLVSWTVGTDEFGLVSEIRGIEGAQSRVGFADLGTD